ncbi:PiggyBac transposable element-derived protein 4 [Portunus trituberculatus]|uniref:PiggyBac transposable element-derived protein 4 n=1 Tax=Portunus trituberculatus TaxID=210409 RepID=A0A5B7GM04_PORTR|nr:PiggyBac transposable element-derived protein 4 [Portunus trituberculatus]
MKDLIDEGRQVFTDNWYTSLRLAEYLLTRKTLITGVVRAGRDPPRELMAQPLSRRQSCFARKGNTLVVKFQDRNQVTVLTTKYEANMVEQCRTHFGNRVEFYYKPLHIDKYNSRMGSVDCADQMLEPYETNRKSLAWFKKLGIHFIFRILLNTFITCKAIANYRKDFMNFILQTTRELLCQYNDGARKLFDPPARVYEPEAPTGHTLKTLEGKKQKRCRVCYPKRKDTRYYCPACPTQPGLCCMDHYREWHNQREEGEPQPTTSGKRRRTQ